MSPVLKSFLKCLSIKCLIHKVANFTVRKQLGVDPSQKRLLAFWRFFSMLFDFFFLKMQGLMHFIA